jgi:hypothetical protein
VPPLPFLWHFDLSFTEMTKMASAIVVGRVQSLRYFGPRVNAVDDHGYQGEWQLLKANIAVENVLKGSPIGRSVEFYFYTSLGPLSGDTNSLHLGDRCVFFLVSDGGVLRAVRDFWRSSIEVGTGRHTQLPTARGASVEETIAVLLLTPGEGLEPRRFSRTMIRAVTLAQGWLGPCKTITLLKALLQSPDSVVRDAARQELAIGAWDTGAC